MSQTVTDTAVASALLRPRAAAHYLDVARPSLYRLIRAAGLPAPIRLSGRSVAWRRSDLDSWIASRPHAGRATKHENAPAVAAEASISA